MTSIDPSPRLTAPDARSTAPFERDLNAAWEFSRAGEPPAVVDLPHDAMITETRSKEVRNGTRTGYFPGGRYRYARAFTIEQSEVGSYIALRFEGVYHRSTVSLNGNEVARHAYGYDEFEVDISAEVVAGENRVEVLVENSQEPNSRWYSGSGIYRPVTLIVRDRRRITDLRITTASLTPPTIDVQAAGADGATVTIFEGDAVIARGALGHIELPDAKLWSADSPTLYRAVVTAPTDEVETSFGIRTLSWSGREGFRVNGVETKLRGACIHHDNGILGARAYADAEARKIRILKESGYNAIRSAHNPCSRALLDACDRYGMYVIDEAFDGWYTPKSYHDSARDFEDIHDEVLVSMVKKDVNHPSVVMYSIGNEMTEPVEQEGKDLAQKLADRVRELDPTRAVTAGVNFMLIRFNMGSKDTAPYEPEGHASGKGIHDRADTTDKSGSSLYNAMVGRIGRIMSLATKGKGAGRAVRDLASSLDIVGYNYAEARYTEDVKGVPDRVIVGSETLTSRLPYNWARVRKHSQVIGDFVWTGWDYLGEIGLGYWRYPSETGLQVANGGGAIDLIGNRDAHNHYQRVVWGLRTDPWIGVRPLTHAGETVKKSPWRMTDAVGSWSWAGCEGAKAEIEVYADAARVALHLNGERIGSARVRANIARFRATYAPGALEAVAYDSSGAEVGRSELRSAGATFRLRVTPDTTALRANGQDLSFISIELVDDQGVVHAAADRDVAVTVDGESAVLAAVGSANPRPARLYDSEVTETWYGRALAVVRAGQRPGEVTVTVKSEGADPVRLSLAIGG